MWDAFLDPMAGSWREGRPGEAIGMGLFEVIAALAGTKGLDKLSKVKTVGTGAGAANKLDEVADAPKIVPDIAKPTPEPEAPPPPPPTPPQTPEEMARQHAIDEGRVNEDAPPNHLNGATAEELGWQNALARGEVGIQEPGKITAVGPDFITFDPRSNEIIVWDAKYSTRGRFPSGAVPPEKLDAWQAAVADAVKAYSGPEAAAAREALEAGQVVGRYFTYP